MRGRKPKPDYLNVVDGGARPREWDDGRCRYPTSDGSPCSRKADDRCWQHEDLPDPDRESYPPPEHLDQFGRACWRSHVDEAVRVGILTQLDWTTFEKFCEAYSITRRAWADLSGEDMTLESSRGDPKKHPSVTVWKQAVSQARSLANDLGFTPTARTRLELPGATEEENPFKRLKRGQAE